MADLIARVFALSAIRVSSKHEFDTLAMLNSYFTLNPNELVDKTYSIVGTLGTGYKIYRYYENTSSWEEITFIYRGNKGEKGDTGTSIVNVEDYDGNTFRITLDNGLYFDISKTNAEADNITVDRSSFTNFLKYFDKNNAQDLMDYIDKIDSNPSGVFYFGDKNSINSWKIIKENAYLNFYRYDESNGIYNYIAGFGSSVTSDRFILNDWAGSLVASVGTNQYRTLIRPSIDKNGAVVGNCYGRTAMLHNGEMVSFYPTDGIFKTAKLNPCSESEGLANAEYLSEWSVKIRTSMNRFYNGIENLLLKDVSPNTYIRIWTTTEDGVVINESCSTTDFANKEADIVINGNNTIYYREDFPLIDNQTVILNIKFSNPVTMYGTEIDLGYGNGNEFVPMFEYIYLDATLDNIASESWVEKSVPLSDSLTKNDSNTYASSKAVYDLSSIVSALSAGSSPLIPTTVEDFSVLQNGINGQHYLFTNSGVVNGDNINARDHAYIIKNFEYTGTDYISLNDYVVVASDTVSSSGIFITDIVSNDGKNVNLTMNDIPNQATVKSIITDGTSWNVTVVWDRNATSWTGGIPTINGKQVSNITNIAAGTFTGNVIINDSDITTNSIIATLGEISYEIPVSIETPPVIQNVTFGDYPTGQTSVKENDTVQITITADLPFTKVTVYNYQLAKAQTYTVSEGTNATVNLTCANRGLNIATLQEVKVFVTSNTGSNSADYTTTGGMLMNNSIPVLTLTTIDYPVGQEALKASESATINYTLSDCDDVQVSSPNGDLSFDIPAVDSVVATRISGDYNITTNNVLFSMKFNENGATSTFGTIVNIVNVEAVCTDTVAVYCKSPITTDIATNFSQKVKVSSISLPIGTLVSSSTSAYDEFYNLQVTANDGDAHSNNVLNANIEIIGMSGIVSNVNRPYGVKGFTTKTITLTYPNNIAVLSTSITTASNVVLNAYIDSVPPYQIGTTRVNSSAVIENVGQVFYIDGSTQIEFASVSMLGGFGYNTETDIVVEISEGV